MVNSRKRKNPDSWREPYENEEILPFKTSLWVHLKELITSGNRSLPVVKEILSSLQSIKCRDICQGRLALDATYELYLALQNLMIQDHYSVNGKELLSRSLGVSINRVVGHLQEIEAGLENRSPGTIRSTLVYFNVDPDIAVIRNEFAHGAIPNVIMMAEAIDKLLDVIIKNCWIPFDGDIIWPQRGNNFRHRVVSNIQEVFDMFKRPRDEPLSYKDFAESECGRFLASVIKKDKECFTSMLLSTRGLIDANYTYNNWEDFNFIPPSYYIVAMKYMYQLVCHNGNIFDLTRTAAEMSSEEEKLTTLNSQYKYWARWLIMKIATEKVVTKWEIIELSKWTVILKLDDCLEKIKKNYDLSEQNFDKILNNYPSVEEDIDDDIKISLVCGTWGT